MNKLLKVLTLVLALVCVLGFTALAEEELKAEAYLAEYYGIELPESELLTLDDMNAALTRKDKVLYIRREDADLADDEYFDDELLGMEVFNAETGALLGALVRVDPYPAHQIYTVKGEKEYLIPAVKGAFIHSVDLDANRMEVHVWEGLATDEH